MIAYNNTYLSIKKTSNNMVLKWQTRFLLTYPWLKRILSNFYSDRQGSAKMVTWLIAESHDNAIIYFRYMSEQPTFFCLYLFVWQITKYLIKWSKSKIIFKANDSAANGVLWFSINSIEFIYRYWMHNLETSVRIALVCLLNNDKIRVTINIEWGFLFFFR